MTQLPLFTQSETDQASSQPDTHANLLVKQGSVEAVKMTDISGQKYLPLFKKSDQIGLFVKTFLATSLWASTKCFLTWQTKPITQSKHFILELYPSMPHTEECDSGSSQEMWPTPIASTGGPYKNHKGDEKKIPSSGNPLATAVAMWPTPTANNAGEKLVENLTDKNGKTPKPNERAYNPKTGKHTQVTLNRAVKMWPTPRARDWKMTGDVANWAESAIGDECLRRAVGRKEATPGSLNPQWVEWLMGYPSGWTDLKG